MDIQRFAPSRTRGSDLIRFEISPLDVEKLASQGIKLDPRQFDVAWPSVPRLGEYVILDFKETSHAFEVASPPIWHKGVALVQLAWKDVVNFSGPPVVRQLCGPVDL